jgi:hypothetical protein
MDHDKQPEGAKRTVYTPQAEPQSECNSLPSAVISVELDEDENIEWI